MSETERLFPIGGLSRLTGVHVRSLRYYEQLGILHPAYVNEQSGYRYYTFFHMRIVEAIQYCVELGIPLKEFHRFISEENGQIDYAALVAYGSRITEEKLARIRYHQRFLEGLQQEMDHMADYRTSRFSRRILPARWCYCIPYDGIQRGPAFHAGMYRLLSQIGESGLKAGYDNGMLYRARDGHVQTFLFINIREPVGDHADCPEIIQIPGGEYLCTLSDESSIHDAPARFADAPQTSAERLIIEVELLTEKFHYTHPIFESRCFIRPITE